ncbi:MAG TPA: aminomethyl-transferring glycine dehydrogenase subunit GcvPA [Candidatus Bathyarchaeia archaeon]|nr:aminomethyl-transferring glycine dehydrogenase subunit GcvPA [Candidatus Bathyarchaeia archaeon]
MARYHPYIANSNEAIIGQMLAETGLNSIDELFTDIPESIRSKAILDLPSRLSEAETRSCVERILTRNASTREITSFLGAGVWPHYVPAAVDALITRGEFLTSYTPYQPEVSQGMLQAMFEYQSLICELLDMDYANSSLYDWSTALGEAARMTVRINGRIEFVIPHYIHPERAATLRTFTDPAGIKIVEVSQDQRKGTVDLSDLKKKLSSHTAGVYIEYPSFLGWVDEGVDEISKLVHEAGSLLVVGVEPISMGVLRPPGDFGADIVIGEGQPLGNHMNFGGPLLGIFACRGESLLRQLPGRIIGKTLTQDGKQDAYCMALQTREQHIRREKATSNICTNEALLALAASIYLSILGPVGLTELCATILDRTQYAMKGLRQVPGVSVPSVDAFHFMEFGVNFDRTDKTVSEINEALLTSRIQGGLDLSNIFPELGQTALYCFTEIHSHEEIDMLIEKLSHIVGGS